MTAVCCELRAASSASIIIFLPIISFRTGSYTGGGGLYFLIPLTSTVTWNVKGGLLFPWQPGCQGFRAHCKETPDYRLTSVIKHTSRAVLIDSEETRKCFKPKTPSEREKVHYGVEYPSWSKLQQAIVTPQKRVCAAFRPTGKVGENDETRWRLLNICVSFQLVAAGSCFEENCNVAHWHPSFWVFRGSIDPDVA